MKTTRSLPVGSADARKSKSGHNPETKGSSCERCKRRKNRCDRRHPSCERCLQANESCVYVDRRKPGFPRGQRQGLESRIAELEKELNVLRQDTTVEDDTQDASVPIGDSGSAPSPHRPVLDRPQTPITDETSLDPEAVDQPVTATSVRTSKIQEQRPPLEFTSAATSLFFTHVFPWMPILDVRRVYSGLSSPADPPLLFYALFGVTMYYSFDSRLTSTAIDRYWKYSKRRIFVEILEEPSFSALEALVVLTLDLSGMTNGCQVWGALSIAAKMAVHLRTNHGRSLRSATEANGPSIIATPSQLHRHRLFWAVYAIDCYISITTNQPCSLSDHDIDYFEPTRQLAWQPEANDPMSPISVFIHQLELLDVARHIQGLFVKSQQIQGEDEPSFETWMHGYFDSMAMLNRWRDDLPSRFRLPPETTDPRETLSSTLSPQMLFLHVFHNALVIHLNGLVAFPPTEELTLRSSAFHEESREACMRSVESLIDILQSSMHVIRDKVGWPLTWSAWVAARFLLVAQYRGYEITQRHLEVLLRCLWGMGQYFQISKKYWRLLRQAMSDLANSSPPDIETGQSVLANFVNLHVSTAEMEDLFRVDPFLDSRDVAVGDEGRPITRSEEASQSGVPAPVGYGQLMDECAWDPSLDNWFEMPLFVGSRGDPSRDGDGGLDFQILPST
ncbi:unnamed protein product [Clonostachys rosea]|uniref:Zn(2)-C6 fungal-type domain-containing protein n=1 Tax=Bionectria ochroleuca TaxID=29856 RepID=A0ABY6UGC1_BIOOC|nr:unnamed protein product [Clonostachys rosea]